MVYENNKIKIFISHRDIMKAEAKKVAETLNNYGVSCFVAHDSITPMRVWKDEIMKGLSEMDAFVCFITNDFYSSPWTNQEIGFALAKEVPMYLYSFDGTDPDGFKLDIQAIKTGESALIECIKEGFVGHPALKSSLLASFIKAKNGNFRNAKDKFIEIIDLPLTDREIEGVVEAIEAPAKYMNQLGVLLTDPLLPEHESKVGAGGEGYYYQLIESKIFSQHTEQRYEIVVQEGRAYIRDMMR